MEKGKCVVDRDSASVREIVGLNIVRLRTAAGLSQKDLGVRLEQWLESSWSRQAVSQAEQGKRAFGVDDLVALSVALDSSIQQLLGPPADANKIVLASGTEIPKTSYEEVVLGGAPAMDEVQRSRIVGHLGELDLIAGVVADRQKALRAWLKVDEPQFVVTPVQGGTKLQAQSEAPRGHVRLYGSAADVDLANLERKQETKKEANDRA